MNIKKVIFLALALLSFSVQAATTEYYQYNRGSGYISAQGGVPWTLANAANAVQSFGYGLYSSYSCTGWEEYYDAGSSPISRGTASPAPAANGKAYAVPLHFWGCNVVGETGRPDDRYTYMDPISRVVCNPGYAVTVWGQVSSCTPDANELTVADNSNEQGAPVFCLPCLLMRGDPVNATNGNEMQEHVDYQGAGGNLISFARTYNSGKGFAGSAFGTGWTHNYSHFAMFGAAPVTSVTLRRPDGGSLGFTFDTASQTFTGPPYAGGALTATLANGSVQQLMFTRTDGTVETYGYRGALTSIAYAQGGTLTFTSSFDGDLESVTDGRGHTLTLAYTTVNGATRVGQMTAPDGRTYQYAYDSSLRLTSVTFPDGGVKQFSYMPATLDGAASPLKDKLVAVTDENGATFASIAYDAAGRAVSTQLGAGVELTTFAYGQNATTVTDSAGVSEVIAYGTLVNRPQLQSSTVNCTADCGANGLTNQFQSDAMGNFTTIVDRLGRVTCQAFLPNRRLPVKVVRGLPTGTDCTAALANPPATAQVSTFAWHPTLNIPTAMFGPLMKTTFTYDAAGRKLTQSDQETSDVAGASGSSATTVGTARVTTWTYNTQGAVLTMKEPRTDVNATTTFAYDASQNLTAITGPTGLMTTYGNYDANGRSQLITAPNGLRTTLAYTARGLPASVTTGGAVTTYVYDAAAQLVSSTLPSGVTLTFTYDTAHRLISTADSLGNRVDLTLDTIGNVLQQSVTGNAGALAYSRQAAYDQLSRATSVTKAQ